MRFNHISVIKNLLVESLADRKYYADSSASKSNGFWDARRVIIYSHVVEKGCSHKNLKPLFGLDRVKMLTDSLQKYVEKGGRDAFVIGTGISTLRLYNEIQTGLGISKDQLCAIPEIPEDLTEQVIEVGARDVTKEEFFAGADGEFQVICQSRHSMRLYDASSLPIEKERLLKCVEIAQSGPSACNRQSVRVKIVLDKEKIRQIEEIQGGCSGFGANCGAVIAITSELGYYLSTEQSLPMIDAGIFAMNLVYALHEERLGSCILNCTLTEKRERSLKEICKIPNSEKCAVLIAVSDLPDGEVIRVPMAEKRKTSDVTTFV